MIRESSVENRWFSQWLVVSEKFVSRGSLVISFMLLRDFSF